jgi:hypothetical protein
MPLEDGYETEKFIKQIAEEIASSITEMFTTLGINETTSFALFIVEHKTGTLQYISDLQRMVADRMLQIHIDRGKN